MCMHVCVIALLYVVCVYTCMCVFMDVHTSI